MLKEVLLAQAREATGVLVCRWHHSGPGLGVLALPGISCVSLGEPLAFSGQRHWDRWFSNLRGCYGKECEEVKKVGLPCPTSVVLLLSHSILTPVIQGKCHYSILQTRTLTHR